MKSHFSSYEYEISDGTVRRHYLMDSRSPFLDTGSFGVVTLSILTYERF